MRTRRRRLCLLGLCLLLVGTGAEGQSRNRRHPAAVGEALAFASFAPLNTELFVARADGSDPVPLVPQLALDYNASFALDGQWVVFTSEREGSADVYRVHPDGSGLERLTRHPAFDDQGTLSPDGRTLAFVSSRSGQADIWLLDLATRGLRNLTNHPGGDFRPAWSPDGQWLAFSSDRDSRHPRAGFTTVQSTEIYVVRRDGSQLRRLTTGDAFVGSPSWSPDGTRLVVYEAATSEVAAIGAPRRLRGTTQIATIDVVTGARRTLTTGAGEKWSPRWLPDGRIAYVSGGPTGGLEFVASSASMDRTPDVLRAVAGARGVMGSPSWSPDGQRVVFHREIEGDWPPHRSWPSHDARYRLVRTGVFASYSPSGERLVLNDGTAGISHNRILRMDADGTHRTLLVGDSVRSALAPAWSPRGDRIAFGFGRFFPAILGPSFATIAVVDSGGRGLAVLTDSTENAGFPSWSPDERRIVYRVAKDGQSALRIVDVASRRVWALTDGSRNDNSPAWSPRGDRIAFTGKAPGEADYDIFTVSPDGTHRRRLTRAKGNDSHPAWSPDGEWIVFTSARGGFKDESPLHPFNPQPYGDLYVMRADGSETRAITDNQFEDGTPTWIPHATMRPKPRPAADRTARRP